MPHAGVSAKEKIAANITDSLARYSAGIEDDEGLITDLESVLDKIYYYENIIG